MKTAGDCLLIELQFDAVEDEVQRTGVKEGWRARCVVIVEGVTQRRGWKAEKGCFSEFGISPSDVAAWSFANISVGIHKILIEYVSSCQKQTYWTEWILRSIQIYLRAGYSIRLVNGKEGSSFTENTSWVCTKEIRWGAGRLARTRETHRSAGGTGVGARLATNGFFHGQGARPPA